MIYLDSDNPRDQIIKYLINIMDIPYTEQLELYNSDKIRAILANYGYLSLEANMDDLATDSIPFRTNLKLLDRKNIKILIVDYNSEESRKTHGLFNITAKIKVTDFDISQDEINSMLCRDKNNEYYFETEIIIILEKENDNYIIMDIEQLTMDTFQIVD